MRPLILFVLVVSASFALEDPTARLEAIQREADAKTAACVREWLGKARLTPVALPAVNLTDAKPSEAKALDEARLINDKLRAARETLADKSTNTDHNLAVFLTPGVIRAVIAAQGMPAEKAAKPLAAK